MTNLTPISISDDPMTQRVYVRFADSVKHISTQMLGDLEVPADVNDMYEYAPKWGTIISISDGEKDLIVGDKVYVDYLTYKLAKKQHEEGLMMQDDAIRTAVIRKSDIYLIVRGEELISANGYCLVEPIKETQTMAKGFYIPKSALGENKALEGVVYLCPKGRDIEVGQRVLFETDSDIPLEFDLTQTMPKVWRVPINEIVGILETALDDVI